MSVEMDAFIMELGDLLQRYDARVVFTRQGNGGPAGQCIRVGDDLAVQLSEGSVLAGYHCHSYFEPPEYTDESGS